MHNLHIIYMILNLHLQMVIILKVVIREVNSLLKLQNIGKHYDKKVILENINLEIDTGEIVSLLGPSGSGKTTLLSIILGLTKADQGKIMFNDVDLSNVSMKERGFNIVFQDYALFPHINAYENIVYGVRNKKGLVSEKEIKEYIEFLELPPI